MDIEVIWVKREAEYFCGRGWTSENQRSSLICPSGKSEEDVVRDIDLDNTVDGGPRPTMMSTTSTLSKQKRGKPQDHRHRLRTIGAYAYRDAATLLADFWAAVDTVLRERGVIR